MMQHDSICCVVGLFVPLDWLGRCPMISLQMEPMLMSEEEIAGMLPFQVQCHIS
jgi:hypothetical protein